MKLKKLFKQVGVGFMRVITLNFNLWFKETELGWKRNKKDKKKSREELLLEDYENGKILQVNNNKDNKEYFKSIQNERYN